MLLSNLSKKYKIFDNPEILRDTGFTTLSLAGSDTTEQFLTFIDDEKYISSLADNAVMVLTTKVIAEKLELQTNVTRGICIVDEPRLAFFKLHNALASDTDYVPQKTSSKMGKDCNISAKAHVASENVVIGNNVTIEEFVSIKENTIIGDNSIIRAGSVIGGEGFEFKYDKGGTIMPVKHLGWVQIDSDVEIQQNSCVDKAVYPWDRTIVGRHSKIDNLVHIAHAVKIGEECLITAGAHIGGRCKLGRKCWVGIGANIRNGITIGDNGRANMGAVVTKDIPANGSVSGNFAIPHADFVECIKSHRGGY